MFEGFTTHNLHANGTTIHAAVGGSGPPLLLLHGYPQTHAMWHAIAPGLAEHFTVVAADLRGYGDSGKPPAGEGNIGYAKRTMARDMVEAMAALGFARFAVAGHDRGGRVAYRMAFDHPSVVTRVAVLDIVPTYAMWHAMDYRGALGAYHWLLLAQPSPLPEKLIGGDPLYYLHSCLGRWAAPGFAYHPDALAAYERAWSNPETVRASCDDYRAGATIDLAIDTEDYGKRRIAPPLLALYGERSVGRRTPGPAETWREWAEDVRAIAIAGGHFLPEEAPGPTLAAMLEFFAER